METAVTPSTLWARVAGGARRQGTGQLCRSQTGRVKGSPVSRWSPNNGCVCLLVCSSYPFGAVLMAPLTPGLCQGLYQLPCKFSALSVQWIRDRLTSQTNTLCPMVTMESEKPAQHFAATREGQ